MEMAKVTSKGQITIPVSIRRRLMINEGDKLLFIDRPDGVMMVNPDLLGSGQDIDTVTETVPKADRQKTAASTVKPPVRADIQPDSQALNDTVSKPKTDTVKDKKVAKVGELNLDSLLDEIRSIGLKI